MPNAAASLDSDFGFPASARRKPARPAKRKKGGGKPQRDRGAIFNSMPRYGAIAISVLIGVGIVVNALMMQHGHHPAPLFAGTAAGTPAAKVAAVRPAARTDAAAPAPAPQPAVAAEAVEPPSRPTAHSGPLKMAHGDDPIARLIGGAPSAAPAHKSKPSGEKVGGAKVATAKPVTGKSGQDKHRAREE